MNDKQEDTTSSPLKTSESNGYGQGSTYGIPAQKKRPFNRRLLYILAALIVLVVIGVVVGVLLLQKTNPSSTDDADSTVITTATVLDIPKVCEGKTLANAAELKKPYTFAAYVNQTGKEWVAYPYFGKGSENLSFVVDDVNTVGCLAPDEATATGNLKCTLRNVAGDKTVNVTQKGVTYNVTFYAAKTGEKISEGKVTANVGTTCIDFAEEDGTYYTMPGNTDAEPVFSTFFAA